jgi:alpha-L-rhamnosidase
VGFITGVASPIMIILRKKGLKKLPVILLFFYGNWLFAQTSVSRLLCEHLSAPIGIDVPSPRLSWQLNSFTRGVSQRSYQLNIGTDSLGVVHMKGNCWSIKKISGEQLVTYKGSVLRPFTKYFWSVTIVDNKVNKASASSSFET